MSTDDRRRKAHRKALLRQWDALQHEPSQVSPEDLQVLTGSRAPCAEPLYVRPYMAEPVDPEPTNETVVGSFEQMAKGRPRLLEKIVTDRSFDPLTRSFAVEALAMVPDKEGLPLLKRLLKDPDPLIREGALIGLQHLGCLRTVRPALEEFIGCEDNKALRQLAADLLDEWEEPEAVAATPKAKPPFKPKDSEGWRLPPGPASRRANPWHWRVSS